MRRYGALGLVLGVLSIGACASDEIDGAKSVNQAPNVWLAAAPPEGSVGSYTVQLFWGGWDPDGEVAYYEFLITDNVTGVFDPDDTTGVAWRPVYSNDSTFVFSADSLTERDAEQRGIFKRSHTFFIRAVDEVGLRSDEPAYRSFTSTTLAPEVRITTPSAILGLTPADIPPVSTIVWEATDYVNDVTTKQDPDSVQWAMVSTAAHGGSYLQTMDYLRDPVASKDDWYPWAWYRAPQDSGKSWTTPPLNFGDYVFAIRAKDEAGAVTPDLTDPVNIRRMKVQQRLSGPTFIITSELVGSIIAATCDYPLTIVDVPSSVDISFLLSACADHYGGTVVGYRYGWDILDLDDPTQWEIDYTPFIGSTASTPPRAFNFGTHTFTAEVSDNSGFCSRIEVKINIIRFTGDRNLLIVDDYKPDERSGQNGWATTNGGVPSDAEHDGFWADMVSDLDGFDRARDMIATTVERDIPLVTMAGYKNIIWSVYGDIDARFADQLPLLYSYIRYRSKRPPPDTGGACSPTGGVAQGKVIPNVIGLAMQAGVHVLIAGQHPVQNVRPRAGQFTVRYPMIPVLELEAEGLQFLPNPDSEDLANPPGDQGFAFRHLCLDVLDFGFLTPQRARQLGPSNNRRYCPVTPGLRTPDSFSRRDDTMRNGIPIDPNFPPIALRFECAAAGRYFAPTAQGIDAEVYNPAYFRQPNCQYVEPPRPCFEPIWGLACLDQSEATYGQPVAFWTSTFAHVVAEDIVGAVAARSVVFGFPPVYFTPAQVKPAIEYIIFDEWQLPRSATAASASR
jgi:hypothetical protein